MPPTTLRTRKRAILIVDGDDQSASDAKRALKHDGHAVERAVDAAEAFAKFAASEPALVLLDMASSGLTDLDALNALRSRDRYVALILASSAAGEEFEDEMVRGLDAGADDFVAKPFDPATLAARVRAQLRTKDLHDRLKDANDKLVQLVEIDDLTGLRNMRSIYDRLGEELSRAHRYGRPTAAVMMDIDDFKHVNDANDHLFGSFVLKQIGDVIRANVRRADLAARYGGDEFLFVLPETDRVGARIFAERLRRDIESRVFKNERSSISLTASFGMCVSEPSFDGVDARNLVRCADLALYEAKAAGKNCVRERDLASEPKLDRANASPARKKSAS